MNAHPALDLDRLSALLGAKPIGHTVEYHRAIDSTMPRAHQLAQDPDVPAGYVVVAEQQTEGRGRSGRSWTAPANQALLASFILKPPLIPGSPGQIPMAAGVAVVDALLEVAPEIEGQVSLKWPNDVLLGQPTITGKVAGILVESAYGAGGIEYAIVGIGINVNQPAEDLPTVESRMTTPVSLRSFVGRSFDRTRLLVLLCRRLARELDPSNAPDALYERWRARISTLNCRVTVIPHAQRNAAPVKGFAVNVSPSGNLIVRDEEGQLHTFAAADVSLRPAG